MQKYFVIEEIAAAMELDPAGTEGPATVPPVEPAPAPAVSAPEPTPAPVPEAPVAETVEPSGVIKVDIPLFMKLLSGGACQGDPHKIASEAAQMCADPAKPCLTVADYEQLCQASAPAPEMGDEFGIDNIASQMDGLPGEEVDEIEEIPAEEAPPVEEAPKGEEKAPEPPKPPKSEDKKEDKPEGKKEDKPEDKKEDKKDKKEDKPVDEGKTGAEMKPVVELVDGKKPVSECDDKGDKGEKCDKPKSKKPWEKDEEEDKEEAVAEEVSKLSKLMSSKSALKFEATKNPDVIQFEAKATDKFRTIFSECVTKALRDKKWLEENGFKALNKYDSAEVTQAPEKESRQFLVLKAK